MYKAVVGYIEAAAAMMQPGPDQDDEKSRLVADQAKHIVACVPKYDRPYEQATASLQAMPMLWGFHTALSYVPALRAVQLVA